MGEGQTGPGSLPQRTGNRGGMQAHGVPVLGRGAVLRAENVALMKEIGIIVLLTASPESIYERVKNSTEAMFASTVTGYNSVNAENVSIRFEDGKIRYSLMPVWMLNVKYGDVMYKYAINGQTGKTVGEFPVDKKKKWLYFAKVYAISLAIVGAAFLLLSNM